MLQEKQSLDQKLSKESPWHLQVPVLSAHDARTVLYLPHLRSYQPVLPQVFHLWLGRQFCGRTRDSLPDHTLPNLGLLYPFQIKKVVLIAIQEKVWHLVYGPKKERIDQEDFVSLFDVLLLSQTAHRRVDHVVLEFPRGPVFLFRDAFDSQRDPPKLQQTICFKKTERGGGTKRGGSDVYHVPHVRFHRLRA